MAGHALAPLSVSMLRRGALAHSNVSLRDVLPVRLIAPPGNNEAKGELDA